VLYVLRVFDEGAAAGWGKWTVCVDGTRTYTSHSTAELRNASFSNADFWLAVVELRCSFVMLSCRVGNGLSVDFGFPLLDSISDRDEGGSIAGGGSSVRELALGGGISRSSGVKGKPIDSVADVRAWWLVRDALDRTEEVEDA
jgi:hypothetical protein